MRKSTIIKIVLSLSGIFIVALLFRQPKFIVEDEKNASLSDSSSSQKEVKSDPTHQSPLDEVDQRAIKTLTSKYLIETDLEKKSIFADSIGGYYRKSLVFDSSAKYFEVAAELNPTAKTLEKAALEIFEAFQNSGTAEKRKQLGQKAIGFLDKILDSNSERADLRIKKAVVQVYTEPMPMAGINALKGIIEQHPSNVEARLFLGEFQFTVGKYDKAIEQFTAVIEIDPTELKALLYLTDCYLALGQKEKAEKYIMILKELEVTDPYVKSVIEKFEAELKKL